MAKKWFIRSAIIFFWLILIFCALYFPRWNFFSSDANTLNVFAWGDIFDEAVINQFQKETGIKVNLSYYSSNEELLVKLKATGGEGYDLIVPSDYAVDILIKENLLQPIDKTKLDFWKMINPALLGHFFDPQNEYSIPFEWELFGLGIDKDYFARHPTTPSWRMIYDPEVVKYKIVMVNDPIAAVDFTSFYLYGSMDSMTPEQVDKMKQVLIQQKQWVTAYADFRGDYFLATRNCAVVLASSSYIWRTKKLFDFVGFVIPEEGTFVTIENLSIPKKTHKDKILYQFINYLYRPESISSHFETFGFFPVTLDAGHLLDMDEETRDFLHATKEDFKKFHFCQNLLPQDEVRDLWVEVKSSSF